MEIEEVIAELHLMLCEEERINFSYDYDLHKRITALETAIDILERSRDGNGYKKDKC